jgi:hypothetical protein
MQVAGLYYANMSRTRPKKNVAWHLAEWMDTLGVDQVDMIEKAGWSKTTASLLYNCRQDISSKLVGEAANALNIDIFELFMRPTDAMALRRLRDNALKIAADNTAIWKHISTSLGAATDNAPADPPGDGENGLRAAV